MYQLFLERRLSSKTHNSYVCLCADLGYRKAIIAFGKDCAEFLQCTPEVLSLVPEVGDSVPVASVSVHVNSSES